MPYEQIVYEKKNRIAKITINRPDAMNALTIAALSEITTAVEQGTEDPDVGVIVLAGAGRAFSAGLDIKALAASDGPDTRTTLHNTARHLQGTMETAPKVISAMVHGFCLTGALEIALACDLIVGSEDAKFGDTHTRWGLRCTWGMSQRLPYRVGELKSKEMTFTSQMIRGDEAARIGLINRAVPAEELEATVWALAEQILENSLESVAAHKHLYNQRKKDAMEKGLEREYTTDAQISDAVERLMGFVGKK